MPTIAIAAATAAALLMGYSGATAWVAQQRVAGRLHLPMTHARPVPAPISRALRRAGVETDHHLVVQAWLGTVVVAAGSAALVGGGLVLAAAAAVGPPFAVLAARGRAAARRTRQLPLALDAVAGGLRGGSSLRVAIADASSVGGGLGAELASIAGQAEAGRPLADVLGDWAAQEADEPAAAPVRLAGAALAVAAELGGPGAAAVDAAAASLRARIAANDEVAALSVQARLSAVLLTLTPVGFAVLLTSLDPTSAHFLMGTRAGWACIATGLTLDAAGAAWMTRLVRQAR